MAQELHMSINEYYHIRDKLVPKHLAVSNS